MCPRESRRTELLRPLSSCRPQDLDAVPSTSSFMACVGCEWTNVVPAAGRTASDLEMLLPLRARRAPLSGMTHGQQRRRRRPSHNSVYRHIEASLPSVTLSADRFLVACGTRPLRRPDVPFDGSRVFDSDQLLWGGVKTVRPSRHAVPCRARPCHAVHMCTRTHT